MKNLQDKKDLKLLVIGLDGATWDVINPLVKAGALPHLARMIELGTHGNLQSTIPPFSAPAWTTFMTGVNPGKHGIFGFVNYNPQSYSQIDHELVTASPIIGRTIFDMLSKAKIRLAAISVPITYPAWSVNGFMVAGEPCPDTEKYLATPVSFANSLTQRYAFLSTFWSKSNDEILEGLYDMDASRVDLAIRLILEQNLDALFVVLGATDRVQHNFWRFYDPVFGSRLGLAHTAKYESVIPETYRLADQAIGRILSHVSSTTQVLVISDHGGGSAATKLFHTNGWLQAKGYLQVIQSRDNLVKHSRRVALSLKHVMDTPLGSRVRSLVPARVISQGRAVVRNIAQIDWSQTLAYRFPMYPPAEGIVINLAGRQTQGIVQPGSQYEHLRDEIINQIPQFADPETGEQVVKCAFRREELYNGPFTQRAPDIVIILGENYTGGMDYYPQLVSKVDPATLHKVNGEHRMQGILLACGPMIKNNHLIKGAGLIDLAPTLLYSLGLPVSDEMDGTVLEDLFTAEFLNLNPVEKQHIFDEAEIGRPDITLTPEEKTQIEKQLKRLGYL